MLEHYYKELLGFFSHSLNDRDAAADIVQDAYVRVLARQSRAQVREPRALLYKTARNLLIDRYRRMQIRAHADIESMDLIAPTAYQPEECLVAQRHAAALLTAIEALPPRCREAFILCKFDGLSHAQIAERMGISKNMVEKHCINGLLACRRCLDKLAADA